MARIRIPLRICSENRVRGYRPTIGMAGVQAITRPCKACGAEWTILFVQTGEQAPFSVAGVTAGFQYSIPTPKGAPANAAPAAAPQATRTRARASKRTEVPVNIPPSAGGKRITKREKIGEAMTASMRTKAGASDSKDSDAEFAALNGVVSRCGYLSLDHAEKARLDELRAERGLQPASKVRHEVIGQYQEIAASDAVA